MFPTRLLCGGTIEKLPIKEMENRVLAVPGGIDKLRAMKRGRIEVKGSPMRRALLLGFLLMSGAGCMAPLQPSVDEGPGLMALAYQGDPRGQALLALAHIRADGGYPTDYSLGFVWAQQSAARGHPLGQFVLGRFYYHGLGIPANIEKAIELFDAAETGLEVLAGDGDLEAACAASFLHSLPMGDSRFPRDDAEAMRRLKSGVKQGHAPSMTAMATLLLFGEPERRNEVEAYRLLGQAARSGYAPAEYVFGLAMTRPGSQQGSPKEGLTWLRRAATRGLREAQRCLALHLVNGWGGTVDPAEAEQWMKLASGGELPADWNVARSGPDQGVDSGLR